MAAATAIPPIFVSAKVVVCRDAERLLGQKWRSIIEEADEELDLDVVFKRKTYTVEGKWENIVQLHELMKRQLELIQTEVGFDSSLLSPSGSVAASTAESGAIGRTGHGFEHSSSVSEQGGFRNSKDVSAIDKRDSPLGEFGLTNQHFNVKGKNESGFRVVDDKKPWVDEANSPTFSSSRIQKIQADKDKAFDVQLSAELQDLLNSTKKSESQTEILENRQSKNPHKTLEKRPSFSSMPSLEPVSVVDSTGGDDTEETIELPLGETEHKGQKGIGHRGLQNPPLELDLHTDLSEKGSTEDEHDEQPDRYIEMSDPRDEERQMSLLDKEYEEAKGVKSGSDGNTVEPDIDDHWDREFKSPSPRNPDRKELKAVEPQYLDGIVWAYMNHAYEDKLKNIENSNGVVFHTSSDPDDDVQIVEILPHSEEADMKFALDTFIVLQEKMQEELYNHIVNLPGNINPQQLQEGSEKIREMYPELIVKANPKRHREYFLIGKRDLAVEASKHFKEAIGMVPSSARPTDRGAYGRNPGYGRMYSDDDLDETPPSRPESHRFDERSKETYDRKLESSVRHKEESFLTSHRGRLYSEDDLDGTPPSRPEPHRIDERSKAPLKENHKVTYERKPEGSVRHKEESFSIPDAGTHGKGKAVVVSSGEEEDEDFKSSKMRKPVTGKRSTVRDSEKEEIQYSSSRKFSDISPDTESSRKPSKTKLDSTMKENKLKEMTSGHKITEMLPTDSAFSTAAKMPEESAENMSASENISAKSVKYVEKSVRPKSKTEIRHMDSPSRSKVSSFNLDQEQEAIKLAKQQSPTIQILYELLDNPSLAADQESYINEILSGSCPGDVVGDYSQFNGSGLGNETVSDDKKRSETAKTAVDSKKQSSGGTRKKEGSPAYLGLYDDSSTDDDDDEAESSLMSSRGSMNRLLESKSSVKSSGTPPRSLEREATAHYKGSKALQSDGRKEIIEDKKVIDVDGAQNKYDLEKDDLPPGSKRSNGVVMSESFFGEDLPDDSSSVMSDSISAVSDEEPADPLPVKPAVYQPSDGKMHRLIDKKYHLPGHETQGTQLVTFTFPAGRQAANGARPREQYSGAHVTSVIPNGQLGKAVYKLMKEAFDHKMLFTVESMDGESCIVPRVQFKSDKKQYPDPLYLKRLKLALEQITRST